MKISRQKRLAMIKRIEIAVGRIRQDGWEQRLASFGYHTDWAIRIVDYIIKKIQQK